jgi:predicted RNase H-like nuclease (RuvC/YqgF family)
MRQIDRYANDVDVAVGGMKDEYDAAESEIDQLRDELADANARIEELERLLAEARNSD